MPRLIDGVKIAIGVGHRPRTYIAELDLHALAPCFVDNPRIDVETVDLAGTDVVTDKSRETSEPATDVEEASRPLRSQRIGRSAKAVQIGGRATAFHVLRRDPALDIPLRHVSRSHFHISGRTPREHGAKDELYGLPRGWSDAAASLVELSDHKARPHARQYKQR